MSDAVSEPLIAPLAPSVDLREVAYYERLATTWWDRQGPFWPLHTLNELRVAYIRDYLCQYFGGDPATPAPLTGIAILDIGCGGGILSESMARLGAQVHGVDVVEKNIQVARIHARDSGLAVDYEATSAEALAAAGRRYEVVLNMEVVEHVADLAGFMGACNRLVSPGGLQFIATINRTPLAWMTAIIGAEYVLGWLPRGTHQWHKFPKPRELEALLNPDGLRVVERKGVRVNPLNRNMNLSTYTGVNYMLVAHKD